MKEKGRCLVKRTLAAGSLCALLFMTGCGDGSDKHDRAVKEESAEEVEQVAEAEEKKEDHVGTRSNPLPVGQTIEATVHLYNDDFDRFNGSLDLSLEDVVRGADAWARIQEENPFNDEPAEGMEYALVRFHATWTEAETDNDPYDLATYDFHAVTADGKKLDSPMIVTPDTLDTERYSGGSHKGYVALQVPVDEPFYVTFEGTEGSPIFFETTS